jgi:hypothetical protein
MEKNKSIEIPKYAFNRSAELSPEEKDRIFEYLDNLRTHKDGQLLDISPERKVQIEELFNNQIEWIEGSLGLRVKEKLPHKNKISFYSLEEFRRIFPKNRGKARMEIQSKEISCADVTGEENFTLSALNHELVHALASHHIFVERIHQDNNEYGIKLDEFRTGYNNPRTEAFKFLNEIATEMINIEELEYLRKKGGADYLAGTGAAYDAGVVMFDMIIEKAAYKLNTNPSDLRREFYKGYFLGDIKALKFIDVVFGKGALKSLAELTKTDYDRTEYQKICSIFGIDFDAFEKKGKIHVIGKVTEVLGGIKIQTNKYLNKENKNDS